MLTMYVNPDEFLICLEISVHDSRQESIIWTPSFCQSTPDLVGILCQMKGAAV